MIEASRCPACRRCGVPPEPRCRDCGAETQAVELAAEGEVLARTRTEAGWVALVELESGARVLASLDAEPALGALVEVPGDREPGA